MGISIDDIISLNYQVKDLKKIGISARILKEKNYS
jgi:hypothetical protein